jgi:hypothetical protein
MSAGTEHGQGTEAPTFFRPPASEGLSALSVGLLLAVLVLGAYVAFNWRGASQPPAPTTSAQPVTPDLPVVAPDTPAPAPPAAAEASPSGPHRCERQGQVLYTDQPCAPGSAVRAVDVSDPLRAGGESLTLYRCKGAGQFWSRVHCQHRGAYVTRAYTVPAHLSLADQIAFARNRMAELTPPPVPQAPAGTAAPARDDKAWRCKRLAAQVAALDDYARHALPPGEQDRVRFERRSARDEQFRLRC